MSLVAVVPLKAAGNRKTRLAAMLSQAERDELALRMFRHVSDTLARSVGVEEIILLSSEEPPGWSGPRMMDQGRGLNEELAHVAANLGDARLLVIHADLPFVDSDDIAALEGVDAAVAFAPSHCGGGTNAILFRRASDARFAFGPGSAALHRCLFPTRPEEVCRIGLALDLDTPEDVSEFARHGRGPWLLESDWQGRRSD
jgi:2-phospho-L-lactate guanylyltransferase